MYTVRLYEWLVYFFSVNLEFVTSLQEGKNFSTALVNGKLP
jgi:hypothetical protein